MRHSSRIARYSCHAAASLVVGVLILGMGPRPVAGQVGLVVGTEHGVGAFTRIGPRRVKLEAAGGIMPLLSIVESTVIANGVVLNEELEVDVYLPAQVGARLNLTLSGVKAEHPKRLKIGVSYNWLIKLGYGGSFEQRVSRRLSLSAGLMYFPEADNELREKFYRDQISDELRRLITPEDITMTPILTNFRLILGLSLNLFD